MPQTVAKGNRLQVMARKLLEADGYVVHTAVRSSQRVGPSWKPFWISQTTDIFNAFDLIATRMDPPRPMRFIQVTVQGKVSERVKKVDPVPINPAVASVEIWAYVGGQKPPDRRVKGRGGRAPRDVHQRPLNRREGAADRAGPDNAGGVPPPPVRAEAARGRARPAARPPARR